ncbi:MAG: hypothetical protein U0T69_00370 [Chitinophagales bacterium]
MKFIDLIEHAIKLGYTIDQQENYYRLIYSPNDSIEINLEIPNDEMRELIDDYTSIEWKYIITNKVKKKKIYSEWFDYYEGCKETKIQDMQQNILEHINSFANQKFNIIEVPVFTLFGKGFLKYKELVFT